MMNLSFPWAPTSCKDGTCGKCVICNVDGASGEVPLGASPSGSFAAQNEELDAQIQAQIQDAQNDEVEAQIQAQPQHLQIQEPMTTVSIGDDNSALSQGSLSKSLYEERQQLQLQLQLHQNKNKNQGQTKKELEKIDEQQENKLSGVQNGLQKMRESLITESFGDLSSEASSLSRGIYEERQQLQQYQNSGRTKQQKSSPLGAADIQSARTVQAGASAGASASASASAIASAGASVPRKVSGVGHLNNPRIELGLKRRTSTIFSKATLSKSSSVGGAIDDLDLYGEMGERNENYRKNMAANNRLSIHENGKDGENSIFEVRVYACDIALKCYK